MTLHSCAASAARFAVLALALAVIFVACGSEPAPPPPPPAATDAPAATAAPATPTDQVETPATPASATATPMINLAATQPAVQPAATAAPTAAPTQAPAEPAATAAPAIPGLTVFTLSPGTVARYKIEEVLAGTGFKVATGETEDVAGAIAVDADGAVHAESSRIAMRPATLRTDSDRRDGYVRRRTLETDAYPEIIFQPTAFTGLPDAPATFLGPVEFTITGDLTVKDQTREVTWDGTAELSGDGEVTGFASVSFTFDDFGMDKPSVAVVLSVEDTILLELDFVGVITGP